MGRNRAVLENMVQQIKHVIQVIFMDVLPVIITQAGKQQVLDAVEDLCVLAEFQNIIENVKQKVFQTHIGINLVRKQQRRKRNVVMKVEQNVLIFSQIQLNVKII